MKHAAIILALLLFPCYNNYAQKSKHQDLDGWKFLHWNTDQSETMNILKEKGIVFREYADVLQFSYEKEDITLNFDQKKLFQSAELSMSYSVIDLKESKASFKKQKKLLIKLYGSPDSNKKDIFKKVQILSWNLDHTVIQMVYDYKYKIVDEMGCCSYTIDIIYSRK